MATGQKKSALFFLVWSCWVGWNSVNSETDREVRTFFPSSREFGVVGLTNCVLAPLGIHFSIAKQYTLFPSNINVQKFWDFPAQLSVMRPPTAKKNRTNKQYIATNVTKLERQKGAKGGDRHTQLHIAACSTQRPSGVWQRNLPSAAKRRANV